ncbi:MAG: phasin family protein, partial [Methylocystis sp.]
SVKSEPVAAAPAEQVPIESAAVDEAVIAAALAPRAPEAPVFVEVVELEATPVVAAQESVAGFAISASTPVATPEAAAWAFKSVELWSENAQAMMGFASALGKAKSLTEVVELQSRFATERFNRFAKLAGEVVPPPKFFFFAA